MPWSPKDVSKIKVKIHANTVFSINIHVVTVGCHNIKHCIQEQVFFRQISMRRRYKLELSETIKLFVEPPA